MALATLAAVADGDAPEHELLTRLAQHVSAVAALEAELKKTVVDKSVSSLEARADEAERQLAEVVQASLRA